MSGISVVLPIYRNAEVLVALHGRLVRVLEGEAADLELVFVDDACPAGSGAVLDQLARQDARVRLVRHECNQGQRLAVWHGLEAARGEFMITMDADLQDPPEAIPQLLAELRASGVGAVFAGRRGEYQGRLRMGTSRLYRKVLQAATGIPGDAGAYVAMTRDTLDRILPVAMASPYLPALLASTGLPVRSIPVVREVRPEGKSAYSEWARLRLAYHGLSAAWKLKRRG
jgi:dolichol-phosphate mannosyltransferase/undecaprenyl-phosphate 4-deoxy-4-formamido-L-arabinose transferase